MKKFFNLITKDTIGKTSFWITILLFVVAVGLVGIFYLSLPPFLPLYNHMPWGYARLGRTYEIFIPLGMTLIFSLTNTYLAVTFRGKEPLLSRFLFVANITIWFFMCLFVIRLLQVTL